VLLMCFLVELFVKKDYMGIDLMWPGWLGRSNDNLDDQ
jgi:hypothetical protein